jgi:hypothetical protein
MSQNDFTIDNQSFPATRADINSAIQALATLSSGSTAPATPFPNQFWMDTTTDPYVLKIRNSANNQWITVAEVNQTSVFFAITAYLFATSGTVTAPSISFTGDRDTGLYSVAGNTIGVTTNGTLRYQFGPNGELGVDSSADYGTSGYALTSNGTGASPSWSLVSGLLLKAPRIITNTATTSYTTPANCNAIYVECVGGGGGSGSVAGGTGVTQRSGGGGGGGYCAKYFDSVSGISPSTSYNITIGSGGLGSTNSGGTSGASGGATSITVGAVTLSANGGGGGSGVSGTSAGTGSGGSGGGSTNGDYGISGQTGEAGGAGGSSHFGFGSPTRASPSGGGNGQSYGGGASGAYSNSASSQVGGNGAQGLMKIWEYS